MSSNLFIDYEKNGNEVVINLDGEIDIDTTDDLREKLYLIAEENSGDIRLNCNNLRYIDSVGLGVLVGLLKKVKSKNNNVYITNVKSMVKKLFFITGLDKVFIIEE